MSSRSHNAVVNWHGRTRLNLSVSGELAGALHAQVERATTVLARWLAVFAIVFASQTANAGEARVLRVAADPNNLPFSNDRLEGFENKIVAIVAGELGASVEYTW